MKSGSNQFLQYRLLAFKFTGGHSASSMTLDEVEALVEAGEMKVGPQLQELITNSRNVCAKLPVTLVDRLDQTLEILNLTKREFIELAITKVLDEVDGIAEEMNIWEFDKPAQEGNQS